MNSFPLLKVERYLGLRHEGKALGKSRILLVVCACVFLIIAAVWFGRSLVPVSMTLHDVMDHEVKSVELFEYTYAQNPDEATHTVITSAEIIPDLTRAFEKMPAKPFRGEQQELYGNPATGYRFNMVDGRAIEVTQVFLGEQNVVVFWPDGKAYTSSWGRPFDGFYSDLGVTNIVLNEQIPVPNISVD
ncbi:hypothetical protein [Timonella sp. A28]|uniref:hypothetical protein n=1 Tax=Timonella sp. A28 TaxID=3442640 RepID=UPI003EB7181B